MHHFRGSQEPMTHDSLFFLKTGDNAKYNEAGFIETMKLKDLIMLQNQTVFEHTPAFPPEPLVGRMDDL